MVRFTILLASILTLLTISGCGIVRGAKDIQTDVGGAEGLNEGPGLVTGKRGGIIIYQK
jgi:hypothetical protein